MGEAIDRARCRKTVTLNRECINWIEQNDINLDGFVKRAIVQEIENAE